MPEITYWQAVEEVRWLLDRYQDRIFDGDIPRAVHSLGDLLGHPCTRHEYEVQELWNEMHELRRRLGDFDGAIEARREAIAAGYRSLPDPEAEIAECHLLAGRRDVADRLFEKIRRRNPDDVWIYNSAGWVYAQVGEHIEAERWAREGIDVALRTGDPDQVVGQLAEIVERARGERGEEPDTELTDRVNEFTFEWADPPWVDPLQEMPEEKPAVCDHCGFDPNHPPDALEERLAERLDDPRFGEGGSLGESSDESSIDHPLLTSVDPNAPVAYAWFPAPEWALATDRWPELVEDSPVDHNAYNRRLEGILKTARKYLTGTTMTVAPITVVGLVSFAEREGIDPGMAHARARYAAEVVQNHEHIAWPPGRNDRCWCGSGAKYKKCCLPAPVGGG